MMRHQRDYADVPDATAGYPKPANLGFLGTPRVGPDPVEVVQSLCVAIPTLVAMFVHSRIDAF
ncbi:hypothetical protein HY971_01795 [Candidatus Kaiserbacteria bacterium]|nr:hypothetical protein [Candidatus Kaiserbacteria bacterium]